MKATLNLTIDEVFKYDFVPVQERIAFARNTQNKSKGSHTMRTHIMWDPSFVRMTWWTNTCATSSYQRKPAYLADLVIFAV